MIQKAVCAVGILVVLTAPVCTAAASNVDCSRKKLSADEEQICTALSKLTDLDTVLLPVTPLSPLYEPARKRVESGDPTLAGRVSRYETQWLAAEERRALANQAVAADVIDLRKRGVAVTPENYVRLVSDSTRLQLARYVEAWRTAEATWAISPPHAAVVTQPQLKWQEDRGAGPGDRSANVDAASKLLREADIRHDASRTPTPPPSGPMDVNVRSAEARAEQLAVDVQPGGNPYSANKSPDSRSQTATGGGTQSSSSPAPGPGSTPPVPSGPDPGSPPPPVPPGPTAPPSPGTGGAGGSTGTPGTQCVTDAEMQQMLALLQQADKAANCAALAQSSCTMWRNMKSRCPGEYAEMMKMLVSYGFNADIEATMCSPNFCSGADGSGGGAPPSGSPETVTGVHTFGPCVKNKPFDCSASDGDIASVCAPGIPANAQILDVQYFSQLTGENGGPCQPNQDCRWGKFLGPAYQNGEQVCADFVHWSSHSQRVVKVVVKFKKR